MQSTRLLLLGFLAVIACNHESTQKTALQDCIEGRKDSVSWEKCRDAGIKALNEADNGNARTYFQIAVKEAEKFGTQDPRLLASLINLVEAYRTFNQVPDIELCLERILPILESQQNLDDLDLVVENTYWYDMARIYDSQRDVAKTEPILKRVLTISMKKLGESHPEVISIQNKLQELDLESKKLSDAIDRYNIASIYSEEGQFDKAAKLITWESSFLSGIKAVREKKYDTAIKYFETALEKIKKNGSFDTQNPRLIVTLAKLAESYQLQGRFTEAEHLLERIVSIREIETNIDDLDLAFDLNSLAEIYKIQNKWREAESLFKRALEIRARYFGHSYPGLLNSRENLALLYIDQGMYSEADDLISFEELNEAGTQAVNMRDYARAIKYFEQAIKKASPQDSLASLSHLASLYQAQDRFAEAEPLFKQALAIREKIWGATHPDTISAQNDFGLFYLAQGREMEAISLLSWEVCNENGVQATKQGDYAKAQLFFEGALKKAEEFGAHDSRLTTSLNNLAGAYQSQGKLAEAEPLFKRIMVIYEKRKDPSHPVAISARNNLVIFYKKENRIAEAVQLMSWEEGINAGTEAVQKGNAKEAMEYFETALEKAGEFAPQDPRLIGFLNSVMSIYQGKLVETESLMKRALTIRAKKLGASHPEILVIQNNLGQIYLEQGREKEALPVISWETCSDNGLKAAKEGNHARAQLFLEEALKKAEKFGSQDSRLPTSLNNLAGLYLSQGRLAKVEPLLKRALAIYEKKQDQRNPSLSASLNNLAGFYMSQGRFAEAESFFNRALTIRVESLGSSHPDVIVVQNNLASLYISQKRFPEAEIILKDSIAVVKKNEGPVQLMIGLLENYASVLQALKQNDEAEKIIRQFTRIKNGIPIRDMEHLG